MNYGGGDLDKILKLIELEGNLELCNVIKLMMKYNAKNRKID